VSIGSVGGTIYGGTSAGGGDITPGSQKHRKGHALHPKTARHHAALGRKTTKGKHRKTAKPKATVKHTRRRSLKTHGHRRKRR
jgi:hypothetical protein